MPACPTLTTERLVLRPFREADLDAMYATRRHPEVRRSLRLPDTYSRPDAWRAMALWLGQWELRGSGQWAVCLADGRMVGHAGLHRPELADWPGLEVGWTFHPEWWGCGYATEAGRRSVAYAFEEMGADEVVSVILPANERSQRVAARLGLRWSEDRVLSNLPSEPQGIWRLSREEWVSGG